MDSKTFVAGLVTEMRTVFAQLEAREALEAESEGRVEVVTLLQLALASEMEASNLAALWLPSTVEVDAKTVFAAQCADEMRHYNLIVERLEQLGVEMSGFDPFAGGNSPLYQYMRGLRTMPERMAAGPFTCEAIAEVRNAQFIELCHAVGDPDTARLYEEVIQPEEIRHHRHGREILEKYATTAEIQQRVTTAVRSTLAIADELRTLAEKTRGVAGLPLS